MEIFGAAACWRALALSDSDLLFFSPLNRTDFMPELERGRELAHTLLLEISQAWPEFTPPQPERESARAQDSVRAGQLLSWLCSSARVCVLGEWLDLDLYESPTQLDDPCLSTTTTFHPPHYLSPWLPDVSLEDFALAYSQVEQNRRGGPTSSDVLLVLGARALKDAGLCHATLPRCGCCSYWQDWNWDAAGLRFLCLSPSATEQKLNSLRVEADAAAERADELAAKNKQLEQELLTKDQEIASLQHKLSVAEGDLDKLEGKLHEHKAVREEHESNATNSESLQRKVDLLESELDTAEKNLRETTEKLRQVDVKAEHFERQVATLEREVSQWEKKYEEAEERYRTSKAELDEVVAQMESL
ncbi:hypothetical protein L1887_47428 [Cichorium endivia]|nr:hypothetical protein L1887_47428 [Cichorium endivia]